MVFSSLLSPSTFSISISFFYHLFLVLFLSSPSSVLYSLPCSSNVSISLVNHSSFFIFLRSPQLIKEGKGVVSCRPTPKVLGSWICVPEKTKKISRFDTLLVKVFRTSRWVSRNDCLNFGEDISCVLSPLLRVKDTLTTL